MIYLIGIAAIFIQPLSAEVWNDQVEAVSAATAEAAVEMGVSRLKTLTEQARAQAASMSAKYEKDPIAKRLVLDRWGYGISVQNLFERLAEPESSTNGFGFHSGPRIDMNGTPRVGPGFGYGHSRSAGYLTDAVVSIKELSPGADLKRKAADAANELSYASSILSKHLGGLKKYSPKNSSESAWKAEAVPAWTQLLAAINGAHRLAASLSRR